MVPLTIDIDSSASVLGTQPEVLQQFIQQEKLAGVLKFSQGWRISVFTLAQVLNTTPDTLLDLLEDYQFGRLMEEVEDEESVEGEASLQAYASSNGLCGL